MIIIYCLSPHFLYILKYSYILVIDSYILVGVAHVRPPYLLDKHGSLVEAIFWYCVKLLLRFGVKWARIVLICNDILNIRIFCHLTKPGPVFK